MNIREILLQGATQQEKVAYLAQCHIETWTPSEGAALACQSLEYAGKPPWLAVTSKMISGRGEVFPYGQLVVKDKSGSIVAYASTNQIEWDGAPESLPQYHNIVGDDFDYSQTFKPDGNTIALMSLGIDSNLRGNLAIAFLMNQIVENAPSMFGATHLVAAIAVPPKVDDFTWSMRHKGYDLDLLTLYELMKGQANEKGTPKKYWWSGMNESIIHQDIGRIVAVDIPSFEEFKAKYHPDHWLSINHPKYKNAWICSGEAGVWAVGGDFAAHISDQCWGVWNFSG